MVNAADKQDIRTIRRLYLQGVNVNKEDSNGRVALRTAAKAGHADLVRQLLTDFGADVNASNQHSNETALHYACKFNREEAIKVLVEFGADNSILNHKKLAASDLLKQKNAELATWLESSGTTSKVGSGQPPNAGELMVEAASAGDLPAIRRLIRQGIHVDTTDVDGRSAFRTSCKYGYTNVARTLLVDYHADINLRNPYNYRTALHLACQTNKEETIKLLLEHGADRSLRDKENFLAAELLQKRNPQLADWIQKQGNQTQAARVTVKSQAVHNSKCGRLTVN